MAKGHTVRGSAKKGFRVTHNDRDSGKGKDLTNHRTQGGSGSRMSGNMSGHGNAQKSGTP